MIPAKLDIQLYRAASHTITIDVDNSVGAPFEIVGTNQLRIYRNYNQAAILTVALTWNGTALVGTINTVASDIEAGSYPYHLWNVNGAIEQPVLRGQAVVADVFVGNFVDVVGAVVVDSVTYQVTVTGIGAAQTYEVNVKDYGAKGDGVTDDTAAIQAALTAGAGKKIVIPDGVYLINDTLEIPNNDTTVEGFGQNSVLLIGSDFGDVINVANAAAPVYGVTLRNFKINKPNAVTLTSGAGIKMDLVRNFFIENIVFDDTFIGLRINGGTQGKLDNLLFLYENANGGTITGRKFIWLAGSETTLVGWSLHCGDLLFNNINGRCGALDYCEIGLEINACDGVWFNNWHIGNCVTSQVLIDANSAVKCTGLLFSNGWVDLGAGYGVHIKGTTPTQAGDYYIHDTKFFGGNVGNKGILFEGSANNLTVKNCFISGYLYDGIDIALTYTGNKIIIGGNVIQNNSVFAAGAGNGILYNSESFVEIVNNWIRGLAHNRHIYANGTKAVGSKINNNTLNGTAVTEPMNRLLGSGIEQFSNQGFNPTGNRTAALGASPYTYGNTFGYPLEVVISAGTVTQIQKGSTVLAGVTGGTFILGVNESIIITYSVAPNFFVFGI